MTTFTGPELCALSAVDAVAALKKGDVSPTEMLEASLERIAAVEPDINALPTICADRAREHIARLAPGDETPWLAGLPVAIKDLTPVSGVRYTDGTLGMADFVAPATAPLVEMMERRGCVVVGKSNTPEKGAGGNTFNDVFGRTRNPHNTALNPGGSSGGAAAALAAGEVWLAHGSDLGGSLRTPATYCGIVGLRPSPGRCGGGGPDNQFGHEGLQGPMARTAADCALLLDAMSGFDPRAFHSLEAPTVSFVDQLAQAEPPKRIAFAPDVNGLAPVEAEVRDLLASAMKALAGAGTAVEETCPDLPGLMDTYNTLRGCSQWIGPGHAPEAIQKHYKKTLRENIAFGKSLTAEQIITANRQRSALFNTMELFLRDFDALACPVVGIGALPSEIEYPTEINGQPQGHYMDWLKFATIATTCGLPAISVPVGFTKSGGAMGIQFIGKPRGEAGLLKIASVMETLIDGFGKPIDPVKPS